MGEKMKFFKKSDVFIIAVILIISGFSWTVYKQFFSKGPAQAEIYYYNQLVKTVNLNTATDQVFAVPQNKHVVFHLYKDGSIRFEKSDCPDQICVHTGKIHIIGETAACLPNGIILKIVPQKERSEEMLDLLAEH